METEASGAKDEKGSHIVYEWHELMLLVSQTHCKSWPSRPTSGLAHYKNSRQRNNIHRGTITIDSGPSKRKSAVEWQVMTTSALEPLPLPKDARDALSLPPLDADVHADGVAVAFSLSYIFN